jgi:glycosyltransferase involved in cell wall biosynthesis/MoaA/NifB/PqqE/SkfB family radical SAM enzyme
MNSHPIQSAQKTSYDDKPLTVNFQANNICNSKCMMCNIWQLKKQNEISVSELQKLLIDPFFSEVQNVGITGGEPTLRDDLFELYKILPAVLPKLKGASFITNGLLFEKSINVYSRINDFYLQKGLSFGGMVSIDGVGEAHDKVRGKKDAFEKTSKALFGLRSRGVQVTVCCTIVKENVYGIHDLLAWCKSNNFYVRFRIAEFINRLYNENLASQIKNFDEYEIKHLVSFFHLLITEYENDESVKATYYSILSLLTGGKRIVECPYQNLDAINLDSEGSYSVCAPKGKLHKCGNDISADVKAGFDERLFIKSNYCDKCIHDYHSIFIPELKSNIENRNKYDILMLYNSPLPFISSENQNTEIDLLKMNKILLVGWYGTETAGDIAILNGIIQEYKSINPELKFVLFSLYPFYSKTTLNNLTESIEILDYHGNLSYKAAQECDAIVMAGGPLMDIPQTKLIAALFKLFYNQKKPGIIEGCGIGPLNVEQYRENVIQIAKMASKIRVRDSASSELLRKYGIQKNIEVRTDPSTSFIKSLKIENQNKEKVIRCFLRELTDEYPQGISSETAFKNITGFIQKLLEWYPELSIELMAMHYFPVGKDDREFAKRIVNEVNDNRLFFDIKPRTPEEILKAMSSAYFCISMRFHSVVFASAINCKFIAIDYTAGGKIKGFLTDTNQLSRIIYLNQLPIINKNKFEKMLNNKALLELPEIQQEEIKDLKIIHLTSVDKGGAGIAAYRLHKGLLKNEYDSTFLVLSKSGDDESVKKIEDLIYQNEQENFWLNQWNKCQESAKKYSYKPEGFEVFTDINSEINLSNVNEIKNSDVINLHWTAGLLDSIYMQLAFFNKPIVWTLHDMNAFTGGCHYSDGCEKYKYGCGGCPQLGSNDENDLSHQIWLKKSEAYKNLNLTIVTPSKWLADCATQSPLFFNFPIVVIPNGFPLDIYKPASDSSENESSKIGEKQKLILFGADYETDRKGFKYLVSALELLSKKIVDYKISLGVFGYFPADFKIPDNCTLINYGKISDENELAKIYGNADVFVLPSLEDNLPNVVIEALACGAPVVGFNIGGVKEQVEHKVNGYLAHAKNVADLADGIHWVLFESNYRSLQNNSRSKVFREYSMEGQTTKYLNLYQNLVENSKMDSLSQKIILDDLFVKAETLIQNGEYSKSEVILTFLLGKDHDNLNYLNDLAVNYILMKDYENAEKFIQRVLTMDTNNDVAQENLEYLKQELINVHI